MPAVPIRQTPTHTDRAKDHSSSSVLVSTLYKPIPSFQIPLAHIIHTKRRVPEPHPLVLITGVTSSKYATCLDITPPPLCKYKQSSRQEIERFTLV